ncbi:hypothetical protein BN946_scf184836.g16 [Trametes cinnabarina]|uniref:Flavodoxin-like domain-containing protein n=1 Tax=Pycnoporus cinnabarinus TaxID=5643 RepID=A0A060S636_PYCCI|nr:hypothetical protein BN946_scf184836.g16 [Trametes cinnabarina]
MASSEPSSSAAAAHHHHAHHVNSHDQRTLTILYATETGTAQDVADRLARLCRSLRICAQVHSMDAYPPEELINESLVLFVVSTTGSGHEPRAMTPLWTMLLRADLPEDLFEDLAFAVFGLGDSAYEKFCWPAKLLSRRLLQLGASEICARGEADDQHHLGVDGALGPWMQQLSAVLVHTFPLPDGVEPESPDSLPPPRVSISNAAPGSQLTRKDPLVADREYHLATVTCNRRLTAEDWYQDVRHFEFSFDEDVHFNPGDVAVIHPEALAADVDSFLACIGYANIADDPIDIRHTLQDQSLPDHLPTTTTLRELFTRYLDINAVPRRSFFAVLKHFAEDELEREKLEEFLSEEGALQIGVQKGFITLPPDPKTPVICIGPGTGIAPMRAIIQERIHDGIHENTLYFGCRSASKDHHYGEEWEQYASEGKLTYRAAFSRDGPEGVQRTYVQHLIREDSARICELIEERGAWVYISGSSNKMPAAVRAAIQDALVSKGGKTEDSAKEYIVKIEKEGRLIEECWS